MEKLEQIVLFGKTNESKSKSSNMNNNCKIAKRKLISRLLGTLKELKDLIDL